ncbi:MAG: hypothetical protein AABZ47_05310 [Planctomycetota bacterium]
MRDSGVSGGEALRNRRPSGLCAAYEKRCYASIERCRRPPDYTIRFDE